MNKLTTIVLSAALVLAATSYSQAGSVWSGGAGLKVRTLIVDYDNNGRIYADFNPIEANTGVGNPNRCEIVGIGLYRLDATNPIKTAQMFDLLKSAKISDLKVSVAVDKEHCDELNRPIITGIWLP